MITINITIEMKGWNRNANGIGISDRMKNHKNIKY